ncbi:queuosine precursor transporter [Candidatus Saccharibacteria bacterium]|nr:queuosine precursor transporter [Candidatus Saccharibacteria bacterium]MCB9834429.1 queuosine precursor transporter [Candidatus Nomurabacteria bacterium]
MSTTSQPKFAIYDLILAVFAVLFLISNLSATKLVSFGPIITDGGAVLFPLTYILGDVLTEVYGYKYAKKAIWVGFGVMLLGVVAFTIVRYLPAAPEYTDQQAFETILGFFPRIVFASLSAFLVGSLLNSISLLKIRSATDGKALWARLIGSTLIGEFFDTLIFGVVAFTGILSSYDLFKFILIGWAFKTGTEILLLPVTYRVIDWVKRVEIQ